MTLTADDIAEAALALGEEPEPETEATPEREQSRWWRCWSELRFRQFNDQIAFGYTSVFLPPQFGDLLQDVPELKESGSATRRKVARHS